MNIRRILLLAIPAAIILATASAYFIFKGRVYVIYLEEQTIRNSLNKRIPNSKAFLLVLSLTVTDVDIHLQDGSDRIGITASAELDIRIGDKPKNLRGTITAYSGIRYDQSSFSIYLIDPVIEDVHIQGLPPRYTIPVARHSHLILQYAATKHPVYTIKDDNLRARLVRAVLKDTQVKNGRLEVRIGY